MTRIMRNHATTFAMLCGAASTAWGQAPTPASAPPTLSPATKLEAFKPSAGSVVTLGFTQLGSVSGVAVQTRELRDSKGSLVRGVLVEVTQSQYREGQSFVDGDELPDLLKGIDALLEVKVNPTKLQEFEVRYLTKGELQITAFSSRGQVRYAIEAGRGLKAQAFVDESSIRKLRAMIDTAKQQIASLSTP